MIMIWKTPIIFIILYIMVIRFAELVYLSLVLYKFDQGGYLPLAFSVLLITIMLVWNYVYRKRYTYELVHKVSNERVEEIILNPNVRRIPGIAFFYSELVQGIPLIFEHYIRSVPMLHFILVFVSIRSPPISRVSPDERFLFRRVGLTIALSFGTSQGMATRMQTTSMSPLMPCWCQRLKEFMKSSRALENDNNEGKVTVGGELKLVEKEWKNGVVHLLGENKVVARRRSGPSGLWKKFVINYAYDILKRNIRQQDEVFTIPKGQLLKVGMTIEL